MHFAMEKAENTPPSSQNRKRLRDIYPKGNMLKNYVLRNRLGLSDLRSLN